MCALLLGVAVEAAREREGGSGREGEGGNMRIENPIALGPRTRVSSREVTYVPFVSDCQGAHKKRVNQRFIVGT